MRPARAIVVREFQRLLRQRGRLLAGLARPLVWLFIMGSGVGTIAAGSDPGSYRRFMMPGVLGMVLMFGAMFAALSTVHDREFGVIRLLLIAPIRRSTLVLAKIASSALVAMAQASVVLVFLPLLGLSPGVGRLVLLLGAMALTASALAALGMLLASRIDSLENFSGVINFVMFPMLFLSGALYPVRALPGALAPLAALNPLTYGVDLMKHALWGMGAGVGRPGAELPVGTDLGALLAALAAATGLTVALFDREARLTRRVTETGGGS